jgi:fatty-acyl-CoA synthase
VTDDVAFLGLPEVSQRIRRRDLSAVRLTRTSPREGVFPGFHFSETIMTPALTRPSLTSDFLVQALSRDLDRTVILFSDGREVTARDMRDSISRYLQLFSAMGLTPERRAALVSKNRTEALDILSAATLAGLTLTVLHPMGAIDDYLYVIEDAAIDTLIYDADHFDAVAMALQARAPRLTLFMALGPGTVGTDVIAQSSRFTPEPLVAPEFDPERVYRISYSGGTTGKPKGIRISYRCATTSNVLQLTEWEWPDEIRHLICSPLSHAGGAVLIPTLLRGGLIVVLPGFDPVSFMEAVEKYRITSTVMVPTMVISLIDHPRFGEFDLSSLEVIFYGASSFPPARLRDAVGKLGPIFCQFYGQAEAPMSVTVMRRDEHDVNDMERMASCGRPTALVRVALLDDDGREVANGQPGEICVRGPLLMSGYHNKPDETARVFEYDWLHTGDVAIRGADGFLRIVDRKKDMIVTGGFNVFAREIEDVLTAHDAVRQAAVIGVPDPKWGEAVRAIVVLAPGAAVSEIELIALVKARKGAVQAPKSVIFADAIPLTGLGKPDKKVMREQYGT